MRPFLGKLFCKLCLLFPTPSLSFATLTWDPQRIEFTAKTADKQAVGIFRFVNSGKTTITITSVKPDCGCTTAELEKQTYAPGETGEIKAVFAFEGRKRPTEDLLDVGLGRSA